MRWPTIALLIFNFILLTLVLGRVDLSQALSKSIKVAPLILLDGEEEPSNNVFTLYLFFSGSENCPCLDDWKNWVDLADQLRGRLVVKAVCTDSNPEKFLNFAHDFNLPFCLYADPNGTLQKSFGLPIGKVSKVLTSTNGDVVYVDTDQVNIRDQLYFIQRLKDHILL